MKLRIEIEGENIDIKNHEHLKTISRRLNTWFDLIFEKGDYKVTYEVIKGDTE